MVWARPHCWELCVSVIVCVARGWARLPLYVLCLWITDHSSSHTPCQFTLSLQVLCIVLDPFNLFCFPYSHNNNKPAKCIVNSYVKTLSLRSFALFLISMLHTRIYTHSESDLNISRWVGGWTEIDLILNQDGALGSVSLNTLPLSTASSNTSTYQKRKRKLKGLL